MTKRLFFLVLLILISCKKSTTFSPCADFEKMYGTWKSIDGDADHYIVIEENGEFTSYPPFERAWRVQMVSVEKINLTTSAYNTTFSNFLVSYDKFTFTIRYSSNFDTIMNGGSPAAYNHNKDDDFYQNYSKRFVKIK